MGLHAAIIRLSPLIYEGEQRYKPYIVDDPRMVSLLVPAVPVASVTPPLKNPGYAPVSCTEDCLALTNAPALCKHAVVIEFKAFFYKLTN